MQFPLPHYYCTHPHQVPWFSKSLNDFPSARNSLWIVSNTVFIMFWVLLQERSLLSESQLYKTCIYKKEGIMDPDCRSQEPQSHILFVSQMLQDTRNCNPKRRCNRLKNPFFGQEASLFKIQQRGKKQTTTNCKPLNPNPKPQSYSKLTRKNETCPGKV